MLSITTRLARGHGSISQESLVARSGQLLAALANNSLKPMSFNKTGEENLWHLRAFEKGSTKDGLCEGIANASILSRTGVPVAPYGIRSRKPGGVGGGVQQCLKSWLRHADSPGNASTLAALFSLAALLSLHGWRLPTFANQRPGQLVLPGASPSLSLRFADEPGRQLDILEAPQMVFRI